MGEAVREAVGEATRRMLYTGGQPDMFQDHPVSARSKRARHVPLHRHLGRPVVADCRLREIRRHDRFPKTLFQTTSHLTPVP